MDNGSKDTRTIDDVVMEVDPKQEDIIPISLGIGIKDVKDTPYYQLFQWADRRNAETFLAPWYIDQQLFGVVPVDTTDIPDRHKRKRRYHELEHTQVSQLDYPDA